jgi:hypothetical protein
MDHPHYITPEEAEDLYCPISMGAIEGKDLCAGPKCMAWRWRLMRYAEEKDPETDSWPAIYSTTHGYCGMLERP